MFVILRHTFRESVAQPIYSLLIGLAAAILVIFSMLPFFTLGEDAVMYKAVGLDIILLFVLLATLFATSKSIFDEIEDRTMLTLMSKPVAKWEVLIGKYLGIILAAFVAVAVLGFVLVLCTWWRIPGDYMMRTNTLDERELARLYNMRMMHISGLIPSLFLMWLQISVLAACGVALSTRFSLVVNLPTVIMLYIAGNLLRFLFPLDSGPLSRSNPVVKGAAFLFSLILPYLETFDLRKWTVYSRIALPGTEFVYDATAVHLADVWKYVGIASVNAIAYAAFALAIGMLLFQSRELGGAEG
jgi:ABC-type transport system involved in multi-copper enzyme maturation permease subunit